MNIYKKSVIPLIATILVVLLFAQTRATQPLIELFPLEHYKQSLSHWINPADPRNNKPLLSQGDQQKRLNQFKEHYVGSKSPWDSRYINQVLHDKDDIKSLEKNLITIYSNQNKSERTLGYGENFRPHTTKWMDDIAENMHIVQFETLSYQANHRGITIQNVDLRALPTDDPHFYSYKMAGQGYPFDNLQMSSLWVGTPVYVFGESRDHTWLLVLSSEMIGWVHRHGIALADNAFIHAWTKAANSKLVAITKTNTSVMTKDNHYLFSAYVGSVFPATSHTNNFAVMVPSSDAKNKAVIKSAKLSPENAVYMPLTATPNHFANIMETLIGRPYGWGGMNFYNDCSAELKSLFTPFGIWLPRHSSDQVSKDNLVNLSSDTPERRLAYLKQHGKSFLTIIYTGGHVALYVGNYPNGAEPDSLMAMTYQNVWGLRPRTGNARVVIGQSVMLPMLLTFPENNNLISQASKKYFILGFLDQMPHTQQSRYQETLTIKSMVTPIKLEN